MEFEISDKCVILMGTAAAPNTLVDVTDYFKTLKTSETVDNEDITTLGNVEQRAKVLAYCLNSATFSADVLWTKEFFKQVGDCIKAGVKPYFEVYPKGQVSGQEKWRLKVLLGPRDRAFSPAEVDKGSLQLTRSGPTEETIIA